MRTLSLALLVVAIPALLAAQAPPRQTVAFVGYSDSHRGTDAIDLIRASRTFFVKLGYAFRP
jgi:hypothetical protein